MDTLKNKNMDPVGGVSEKERLDELYGKGSLEKIRDFHKKKITDLGKRAANLEGTVRDRRSKTKYSVTAISSDGKTKHIPGHGEEELTSVERNRNTLYSKRDLESMTVKRATGLIKKRKSLKEEQLDEISGRVARNYLRKKKERDKESIVETTYSARAASAGKDIGKPGKNFSKIAASASKKYGSDKAGKKVAGAILAKIRAKRIHEENLDEVSAGLAKRAADKADQKGKKLAIKYMNWSKKSGKDKQYRKELDKQGTKAIKQHIKFKNYAAKKLNELNQSTIKSYGKKAMAQIDGLESRKTLKPKLLLKMKKRDKGLDMASKKLDEVSFELAKRAQKGAEAKGIEHDSKSYRAHIKSINDKRLSAKGKAKAAADDVSHKEASKKKWKQASKFGEYAKKKLEESPDNEKIDHKSPGIKKLKDGSYWAKSQSGTMKVFKSEKAAIQHSKKSLNELSYAKARNAKDKAKKLGKYDQADKFKKYAEKKDYLQARYDDSEYKGD